MKKLLQVSAVLLAAVLMFAGCKNNADEGGDDLPGKWTNELQFFELQSTDNRTGCQITASGDGNVICKNDNPTQTDPDHPLTENHFRNNLYAFASDINLTGFEATAKCTSAYSTYGFSFNISDDWKNMYQINFQNNYFIIQKEIDGTWSDVKSWTKNTAIKAEPAENSVVVYKDGNSIIIKVNGTNIYTIENPEITQGKIGYQPSVGYEDIASATAYTITYKLKQAQYEE